MSDLGRWLTAEVDGTWAFAVLAVLAVAVVVAVVIVLWRSRQR